MIRFFVYGLPVLLVALIVAALVNVSVLKTAKKNELTIANAEPTKLNPILSAESAASTVEGFLFEGLLQYNENFEIIPQLASSFELSQTTTIFFKNSNDALSALLKVQTLKDRWAEWKLTNVRLDKNQLILQLTEPGMDTSEAILAALDASLTQPITNLRITTGEKARETLEQLRKALPDLVVEREWFDYDAAIEISTTADGPTAEEKIIAFLATTGLKDASVAITETRPFLAEPTVRFLLREDVRWHDGAPFTSADVAFTYKALMDEKVASPRKSMFDQVLRVETPGPHEAIVRYRKPFSPALNSWLMSLLPSHILADKPIEWWNEHFNRNPVGTGPFKFAEWRTNELIRLTKNKDYYQGAPWLDNVVFRNIVDEVSERLAFETHQVDYWGVDPWAVASFKKDPKFQVFSYPSNAYSYVGWNLRLPIFQDIRVRTAFAHAVNVPQMIKYLLYGNGVQSTGIFPPHFWFANQDITPIPYDPAKAAQLLDEAGWKPGPDGIRVKDGQRLSFKLITNQGTEVRKDIATLVQDNLRAIGVEVKVEIYEWAVFITKFINKLEFQSTVLGWTTPPDYDAYQVWHSSQTNPEQLNFVGYKNPKVDKLMEQIQEEYKPERIKELAGEIQRIIYEDQPYLFLFVSESTAVIWKDSFRICRPDGKGGFIDTPVQPTKAGWSYYMNWFYRPEYADQLPKDRKVLP